MTTCGPTTTSGRARRRLSELCATWRSPERTRLILMACPEFLTEVHDTIMKRYAAVEIYLREVCGIDQDALHKPKDRLLGKARTPRTVRCGARATPHRPRKAG